MSALRDRAILRAFRDLDLSVELTAERRAALETADRVVLALEGLDPDEPVRAEALVLDRRVLVTAHPPHPQLLVLVLGEERPRWVAAERVFNAPMPALGAEETDR